MPEKECPTSDSKEWDALPESERKRCRDVNLPKYIMFNSFNMIIVAIIGGFVFALALMISDALKAQLPNVSLYWFALLLFGIVLIFAFIQYYVDKRKNYYLSRTD